MRDLGIESASILHWFEQEQDSPYVLVHLSEETAGALAEQLGELVRRCYADDAWLAENAERLGLSESEILATRIPDPGSTMAGDFGEILVFLYHGAREHPLAVVGPKKWRLKHDRTKPAPHSDVVQFIVPDWPDPSDRDSILCSEVKTKSTNGRSTPVASAIEDCKKDRTSRLGKTLVWLRERAFGEDLGSVSVALLDRFINLTDYPEVEKRFHAIAVVCSALLEKELEQAPSEAHAEYTVVVISVPELKSVYERSFEAVRASVADSGTAR